MNFHNAEKAYLVNSCDMYHLYPEYGMQKVNGTYRTNSIGRIFRYLPTQRWKPPLKSGRSDSSKVFTFPFSFKSQIWPFRFSFSLKRKSRHPYPFRFSQVCIDLRFWWKSKCERLSFPYPFRFSQYPFRFA